MCGRYGRRVNHQERLSKEKLGMTSRDPEGFSYNGERIWQVLASRPSKVLSGQSRSVKRCSSNS